MKLWLASIMTCCDGLWEDTDLGWYHRQPSNPFLSCINIIQLPNSPPLHFYFLYPPSDTLNVHGSVKATCISHIETDPAFKLQTDTKCGDSGGLDTQSLYSHWSMPGIIGLWLADTGLVLVLNKSSQPTAVWSRDHYCATVVSAPKMLQISNPRPEWSWYDLHILILSICLHYFVPTNTNKYQKDILDHKKCILMDTEQLFIVRKEIFLIKISKYH